MVRPNELSFARRGALSKLADRARGARPGHLVGRLVGLDSEDDHRAIVAFGDAEVSVLSGPHKLVPGALVAVEVDSTNAPTRITGPVTTRPEGLDEDVPAPDAVVPMPELGPVEFSPEDQAILDQTVADLGQAQADLQDAFERIGNLATEVGFAWSGHSEEAHAYPPGTNFRVDWTALGGGEFRLEMKNIPTGANYAWNVQPQGESNIFIPDVNPVVVTVTEPGSMRVYAWADDENIGAEFYIEVHPPMLDATGPLQAAIADASAAAVRASRIAPRSLREPTVEDGDNRPTGAVWTLVNAEGEELAYWAWNGTAWIPQALSTQVIPYLDAAHISTGVMDADRINVTEIWGKIATFGKIITQDLIATGAVTSRHLNVVPEEGTGGMELLPPGIRIIPPDAEAGTAVSLRTDEENWIAFAKAGKSTFSVNPDGHLTAQQVDANESLTYRGDELSSLLDRFPRGIISNAVNDSSLNITVGTNQARLVANTFRTPAENRMVRVSLAGKISTYGERFVRIYLRQSTGNNVNALNSSVKTWHVGSGWFHDFDFTLTQSVNLWGWPYDNTITLGVFLECVNTGETVELHRGNQSLIVEDVGPSVRTQVHTPWAPTTGGGGGGGNETEPGTRDYTYQRKSSWVRSFLGNNNHYNYGAGRAYQGLQPRTSNGNLKSMIGWPSLTSTLSEATIKSIKVRIKNDHTYAYSGATAYIGLHGHTSAPATFALSASEVATASFTRGQTRTLTIPSQYHAGFKNGDYTGIVLYTNVSSNARYGYWDGANTELIIEYEK